MNKISAEQHDDVHHPHVERHATPAKPYVVSLDIATLLAQWANRSGFKLPAKGMFDELRTALFTDLSHIFSAVEFLSETSLRGPLARLVTSTGLPVLSLDEAYYPLGYRLGMTRAVHADRTKAGNTHRAGMKSVAEQIDELVRQVQGDVVLVDDVIFTGKHIADELIPMLSKKGINIKAVVAAVGMQEGITRIGEKVPHVQCVRTYDAVEDEICERDFFPGVPLSGRTVLGLERFGMPYVEPFGDPNEWACIPTHHVKRFSRSRIADTIRLYEAIERASCRIVRCSDLARPVYGLPTGKERFVDVLART
jgi:hypothetical protein